MFYLLEKKKAFDIGNWYFTWFDPTLEVMIKTLHRSCRGFNLLRNEFLVSGMDKIAIENEEGVEYSYGNIFSKAESLFEEFLSGDLNRNRENIAFLFRPSFDYVAVNFAIWMGNQCAVPLSSKSPVKEMEYIFEDSEVTTVFYDQDAFSSHLKPLIEEYETEIEFIGLTSTSSPLSQSSEDFTFAIDNPDRDDPAVIFYTSGTTGPPKGVVHSFGSLDAQMETLVDSWELSDVDKVLHALPLHHVHGVVNALFSTLYAGGTVRFCHPFDPLTVWEAFKNEKITVFHAVPTIYGLLSSYAHGLMENENDETKKKEAISYFKECCSNLRLMVSGSAGLPVSMFNGWEELTGQTLLERYGMTEFGMALGNPYHPVENREAGKVGHPLGGMEMKIEPFDEGDDNNGAGELWVRGPQLFSGYYNQEDTTRRSYSPCGEWFMTGDVVTVDEVSGVYQILGRMSQDIIKSAGYKISALDIEREIFDHENVLECCVLGMPDEILGEVITAVLVLKDKEGWSKVNMMRFLKDRLSLYKVPREYVVLEDPIPRNQMGKINKSELKIFLLENDLFVC